MIAANVKSSQRNLFFKLALGLVMLSLLGGIPRQSSLAQTSRQWYKTDLHVHSVISADAYDDLGILSQAAKSQNYNALFLTDHNLASSFPISSLTANYMVFEDSYRRWTADEYGVAGSRTNELVTTPVHTGTNSLHLASNTAGYGETFVWTNRGPNFRSGDILLKVSIYPTRIDLGSGVYVSASIGGDVTVQSPNGYTTSDGVISVGVFSEDGQHEPRIAQRDRGEGQRHGPAGGIVGRNADLEQRFGRLVVPAGNGQRAQACRRATEKLLESEVRVAGGELQRLDQIVFVRAAIHAEQTDRRGDGWL